MHKNQESRRRLKLTKSYLGNLAPKSKNCFRIWNFHFHTNINRCVEVETLQLAPGPTYVAALCINISWMKRWYGGRLTTHFYEVNNVSRKKIPFDRKRCSALAQCCLSNYFLQHSWIFFPISYSYNMYTRNPIQAITDVFSISYPCTMHNSKFESQTT